MRKLELKRGNEKAMCSFHQGVTQLDNEHPPGDYFLVHQLTAAVTGRVEGGYYGAAGACSSRPSRVSDSRPGSAQIYLLVTVLQALR